MLLTLNKYGKKSVIMQVRNSGMSCRSNTNVTGTLLSHTSLNRPIGESPNNCKMSHTARSCDWGERRLGRSLLFSALSFLKSAQVLVGGCMPRILEQIHSSRPTVSTLFCNDCISTNKLMQTNHIWTHLQNATQKNHDREVEKGGKTGHKKITPLNWSLRERVQT